MSDAAKAARGSFNDIKSDAENMASETSGSMSEARHSVVLLGEEFGIHLPRGVTAFLTSLGPVAAAMESAFPLLAIAVGAKVLFDALAKNKEAAEKVSAAFRKVADIGADAFSVMQDRLIQAEIKADELAGDHLGALQKKLELIDQQTMHEVIGELDKMAGAADTAFKGLEHGWFMRLLMGDADVGPAKQQLQSMIAEIDKLKQGGGKATDVQALIGGDIEKVKADMDGVWNRLETAKKNLSAIGDGKEFAGMRAEAQKAANLAQQEWDYKQKELDVLTQMQRVAGEGAKAGDLEGKNTRTEDAQREAAKQNEIYMQQQEGLDRLAKAEQDFYNREHKAADAARKQAREIASQMAEEQQRATEAVQKAAIEKIEAEAKINAALGKEEADHSARMGELQIEAQKLADEKKLGMHRQSQQEALDSELKYANEQFALEQNRYAQEIAALDQHDKEYEVKLKQLQDKETELTRAHENQLAQIREKAEEQSNSRILSARQRFNDTIASGLTQSIMGHETWAKMLDSLGSEVVSGMIQNAIQSIMANDMTKQSDAARAAREMYKAGASLPPPLGIVAGPALAAGAYAAVLAFAEGGIVPGVGIGDIQPAMLEPGETVISKKMTEQLQKASSDDNRGGDVHVHVNLRPSIQALDSESMERVLNKHADVVARHVSNQFRRMNR